ncbi:MAG: hypothetical protein VX583_09835 [Bdellovibrionota bacterium]|tara:strand:+ start:52060 stop:52611 length:552 start_codon:yes stop_codon:yes gene_type:complete
MKAFAVKRNSVLGMGFLSPYVGELSNSSSSAKGTFVELLYPISYKSFSNAFDQDFFWKFSLLGLLPEAKDEDDSINYYQLQLSASFLALESQFYSLFYGLGMSYEILKGNGGSMVLNNGSGYSSFQRPDGTSSAQYFYLEFGVISDFEKWRLDTSIQLDNPLGEKRSFSFLLEFLFRLDQMGF